MKIVLRALVVIVTIIVLGAVNADVIVQPGYGQSHYPQNAQRAPTQSFPRQQPLQLHPHVGHNVGDARTSLIPNYFGYPITPYRGLPSGGRLISLGPLGLQTLRLGGLGGLGGYGFPFLQSPNSPPYIAGRSQFPGSTNDQFKSASGHEGRDSARSSRKSKDDIYDVAPNTTVRSPNKAQGFTRTKYPSNDKSVSPPKNNKSDYDVVGGSLLDPLGPTHQARGYLNGNLPTYYPQSSRTYDPNIGNQQNQKNLKMQQQRPPGTGGKGDDKQKPQYSQDQHKEPSVPQKNTTVPQAEYSTEQYRMAPSDWQQPYGQMPWADQMYVGNQPHPAGPSGGPFTQEMQVPGGEGTHANWGNPASNWRQMTSAPSPYGENRIPDWMHFPYTSEANPSYGQPEIGRADSLASRAMHQVMEVAERLGEFQSPENNWNVGGPKSSKGEPNFRNVFEGPSDVAQVPDGRFDSSIYRDYDYFNSNPGFYRGYQPAPYYQPNIPNPGYLYQYPMRGLPYRPA